MQRDPWKSRTRAQWSGNGGGKSEREEFGLYGDEEAGTPQHEIYHEPEARRALEDARVVCHLCQRLIYPEA